MRLPLRTLLLAVGLTAAGCVFFVDPNQKCDGSCQPGQMCNSDGLCVAATGSGSSSSGSGSGSGSGSTSSSSTASSSSGSGSSSTGSTGSTTTTGSTTSTSSTGTTGTSSTSTTGTSSTSTSGSGSGSGSTGSIDAGPPLGFTQLGNLLGGHYAPVLVQLGNENLPDHVLVVSGESGAFVLPPPPNQGPMPTNVVSYGAVEQFTPGDTVGVSTSIPIQRAHSVVVISQPPPPPAGGTSGGIGAAWVMGGAGDGGGFVEDEPITFGNGAPALGAGDGGTQLATYRYGAASVTAGQPRVAYVSGGIPLYDGGLMGPDGGTTTPLDSLEVYDNLMNGTIVQQGVYAGTDARAYHRLAVMGNLLLEVGGWTIAGPDQSVFSAAEPTGGGQVNFADAGWLNVARLSPAVYVRHNRIYVIGGFSNAVPPFIPISGPKPSALSSYEYADLDGGVLGPFTLVDNGLNVARGGFEVQPFEFPDGGAVLDVFGGWTNMPDGGGFYATTVIEQTFVP